MDSFKYASIDLETTGLDPEYCQIIQFGMVLDDLETSISELPTLELLIVQPDNVYRGQSFALDMNADIISKLKNCHVSFERMEEPPYGWAAYSNLAQIVRTFLVKNGWVGDGLLCAGKNYSSFDAKFLEKVPGWEQKLKPRHRVLDPGSMYYRVGDGSRPPGMQKCKERAGIPGELAHTAVADALDVVKLIRFKMGVPFGPEPCEDSNEDSGLDGLSSSFTDV